MDGLSLPQPSTCPFLSVLGNKQSPLLDLALSPPWTSMLSPGPLFYACAFLDSSVFGHFKANWGDQKFTTLNIVTLS